MIDRGKIYDQIIHSWRWQQLRLSYVREHPVCEDCAAIGRTRPAEEVHHIIPIESASGKAGMEALAYDRGNLRSLCHDCHAAEHIRLGSRNSYGKRDVRGPAKAQAEDFLRRWCGAVPSSSPGV